MGVTKSQTETGLQCWSCHAPMDSNRGGAPAGSEHFCPACGKIQPLPRGTDYFAFFGLPQTLRLDAEDLERRFHKLSWRLHPDNFVRASEYERELSLERGSQLNDAYRTLREPISRVEYMLGQAGMRKEGAAKQQAPPELLEEVFELNMSLEGLREARAWGGSNIAELREPLVEAEKTFTQKLAEVDAALDSLFAEWDLAVDRRAAEPERQTLMNRMNEILNRRSYIRNLVASVQKELAEA